MKIRISLLATALAAFLCAATGSAGTIVSDPALRSSTYAGGGGFEMGLGAAVDAAGNMYVTGRTESGNYPTTPNAVSRGYRGGISDAFVAKFEQFCVMDQKSCFKMKSLNRFSCCRETLRVSETALE